MFDSCSAYQNLPEILFLSHCVPNPPDKGERIRAYHALKTLAKQFRVHLVCFAKHPSELEHIAALDEICTSVHVQLIAGRVALARAAMRFAMGDSISTAYYDVPEVHKYVRYLAGTRNLAATFCYTAAVAQFAPADLPVFLDFVDIDSEKWFQYCEMRQPAFAYKIEGRRLRRIEAELAGRSEVSILTTRHEASLLEAFSPKATTAVIENGVDCDFFDPRVRYAAPDLKDRKFIVFTGVMSYFPNVQAVCNFAAEVYPTLRRMHPDLEFFIVGRDPSRAVQKLAKTPGIVVTGGVPDIRPYLAYSAAVVAPLEIARGIQNKVLEALAMGKQVYCSTSVAATFGAQQPVGVHQCDTPAHFLVRFSDMNFIPGIWSPDIREAARQRFSWANNLKLLTSAMEGSIAHQHAFAVGR